ncbi:MAG TPA: beta-propeller domain-containing protein [Polyangiales bacterium]
MHTRDVGFRKLLGTGLMLGFIGCADVGGSNPAEPPAPDGRTQAHLSKASDCGDLLTKIQDDAIAKVKLAVERAKTNGQDGQGGIGLDDTDEESAPPPRAGGVSTGGSKDPSAPVPSTDAPNTNGGSASGGESEKPTPGVTDGADPSGASETNSQVAGVEEADFVKVVKSGAGIFLLHGSSLLKLKSYPAAETALSGTPLTIEGSPSELFVTDAGKAIIFSNALVAEGSQSSGGPDVMTSGCAKGGDCYDPGKGSNALKITIADFSGDVAKVERELYYEGSYVSARRYSDSASDVVRVVVQGGSEFYGLYEPQIQWYDAWGKPYDDASIASQLEQWQDRQVVSIRKTVLTDWLPTAYEGKDGKTVELSRQCESYYVPVAGLAEYGLTQVLTLDLTQPASAVGGVTVVGNTSTVYSNGQRLVLAQPDYRWNRSGSDLGVIDGQSTAFHVFDLTGANTKYSASGWIDGFLPPHNPQFGIDVASDGTLRIATTGMVRDTPNADRKDPKFWVTHPETRVTTAKVNADKLEVVGKTPNLGLPRETIQSARFVGDRAYVVTFQQTDPLVVVDVKDAANPHEIGPIKIPGFSQYMHPLDDNHLITVGQSGTGGMQLQLFDVSNPAAIPQPKLLDFGSGSSSSASYEHKAFTFYQGTLAIPVSGYYQSGDFRHSYFSSALQLVKVDANAGFTLLGTVDHTKLYADNGLGAKCGVCDAVGCYDYACGYQPEVRRGAFVSGDDSTYVYSFSYAGVLVNDLADLSKTVASVSLPQPTFDYGYGGVDYAVPPSGSAVTTTPERPPVDAPDRGRQLPVP